MARSPRKQPFVTFVNKRYKQLFKCWDDYALFLYYDIFEMKDDLYYAQLEKDIWDYSDMQVGGDKDYERFEIRKSYQTENQ